MITLFEFIEETKNRRLPKSQYVRQEGFDYSYVRCYKKEITFANIKVTKPGQSTFTNLLKELKERYPDYIIKVENALTTRFREGLKRRGFVVEHDTSFILPIKLYDWLVEKGIQWDLS